MGRAQVTSRLRKVTLNAARLEGNSRKARSRPRLMISSRPLTADGHIDLEAWKQHRGECFRPIASGAMSPRWRGPPRQSRPGGRPRRLDLGPSSGRAGRKDDAEEEEGLSAFGGPRLQGPASTCRLREEEGEPSDLPGGQASAIRDEGRGAISAEPRSSFASGAKQSRRNAGRRPTIPGSPRRRLRRCSR